MVHSQECVGYYWLCKKLDFPSLSLGGPRHGARVWCLGRVPKHMNQWQEEEGLLFSPKNYQFLHILSFCSLGVVSLFIFPTGMIALDSEPRGRRYGKNMIYNMNHNILCTLKNEPLNIMLLHTSRRMDGPWIKMVPVVSHIFDVSSSTVLGIKGYLTYWKP